MDSERDKTVVAWLRGNRAAEAIPDLLLVLLCGVVVGGSVWLSWHGSSVEWVSRSGSVMVLVGATLEYRNANYLKIAMEESIRWASGVGGPVIFEWAWYRRLSRYVAHTLVVAGTLLWGYGDVWIGL